MRRHPAYRRLFGFLLGTAGASAASLIALLLLARNQSTDEFLVLNTVLLLANLAAQLGGGFDSASARFMSRGDIEEGAALSWTSWWRGVIALPAALAAAAIALSMFVDRAVPIALAAMVVAHLLALNLLAISMVPAQARSDSIGFALGQMRYYGPLLVSAVVASRSADLSQALRTMALGGGVSAGLSLWSLRRASFARPAPGTKHYKSLAVSIFASGVLFTITDRLDVVAAAAAFDAAAAANYAVAARLSVLFVIVVSASQTFNIGELSAAKGRGELDVAYRRQWMLGCALAVAAAAMASLAPDLSGLLFGPNYAVGRLPLLLLTLPYVLFALYSPYLLAMAALGQNRALLLTTLLSAGAKALIVAVALLIDSLLLLYASGLVAALVGAAATLKYRRTWGG